LNETPLPVSNRPVVHRLLFALILSLSTFALAASAAETLTEKTLRDIVERQKRLFARAEQEGEHLDEPHFVSESKAIAASYDILIQKNPDYAPAFAAYGVFLGKIDMNREAVAMLLKANKLDPSLALVKNQLAKHLAEDGKPLDALPYLTAAIDLEPKEPLYHLHFAKLLMEARDEFIRSGEWNRAALEKAMLGAFQRAAELSGDFAYAYQHAKAYYELDPPRWAEALKVWQALEQRAPSTTTRQLVRLQQANVLVKLDRPVDARALLDQITDMQLVAEKQQVIDALKAKEAAGATNESKAAKDAAPKQ
jgi:tetratricopeptide (TPR) repeat protein